MKMWGFNRKLLFVVLMLANFLSFMVYSIQAPILPRQAHHVGASTTQLGFVFGIYELANLITCPIVGAYAGKIGMTRTFSVGVFALGISTVLFGFINRITSPNLFISVASFLRIIEAIGASTVDVGIYCIVGATFGDNLATAIGLMEGVYGIALSIGPYIGSWLYEIGGFRLPFFVSGACVILTGFVVMLLLSQRPRNDKDSEDEGTQIGVMELLSHRPILMYLTTVGLASVQLCSILALLEIHLRQFNLNPTGVGRVFLLHGGVAAIVTPICSYLTGKVQIPEMVPFIGSLFYVPAYLFLGPVQFMPLQPSLSLVIFSVTCLAIANSSNLISGFIMSLNEAKKIYPSADEAGLSGVISSLYISTIATGCLIGPIMGGTLYDFIGFPETTSILILLALIQIILIPVFRLWRMKYSAVIFGEWQKFPRAEFSGSDTESDTDVYFSNQPLMRRRSSILLKTFA